MTPTREQITEGRDEALEHLGLSVRLWETLSHDTRRNRMRYEAARSGTSRSAAMTVATAERDLAVSAWGALRWHGTAIQIGLTEPLRQSDFTLQA